MCNIPCELCGDFPQCELVIVQDDRLASYKQKNETENDDICSDFYDGDEYSEGNEI